MEKQVLITIAVSLVAYTLIAYRMADENKDTSAPESVHMSNDLTEFN